MHKIYQKLVNKKPYIKVNINEINLNKVPIVIGGSAIDITSSSKKLIRKTSNPGTIKMSFGGVGR